MIAHSPTATQNFLSNPINALVPIEDIDDLSSASSFISFLDGRFRSLKIHGLRLLQTSESAIRDSLLLTSERNALDVDPLLRMLSISGRTVNAEVDATVTVSDPDSFGKEVISSADKTDSNLILIPVHRASDNEVPTIDFKYTSATFKFYVEELVNSSGKSVAVFCDRSEVFVPRLNREVSLSEQALLLNAKKVVVLYTGGKSCDTLLSLASHMVRSDRVHVTVMNVSPDAKEEETDPMLEKLKAALSRNNNNIAFKTMNLDTAFEFLGESTGRSSAPDLVMFPNDEWSIDVIHANHSSQAAVVNIMGSIGGRIFESNMPCALLSVSSL
jgi:hypothetical protein